MTKRGEVAALAMVHSACPPTPPLLPLKVPPPLTLLLLTLIQVEHLEHLAVDLHQLLNSTTSL
jgi:hypothetical protein